MAIAIFVWRTLQGSLPNCPMCAAREYLQHLLFHCPLALAFWNLNPLLTPLPSHGRFESVQGWFDRVLNSCFNLEKASLIGIL